ncbi:MAG: arginase family protein [Syntrophales bacterium]|jgi:agmatinase
MNFGGLEPEYSQHEHSHFVVVPVPYDLTSTYQSGSRRGPSAILDASSNIELHDEELQKEVFLAGIHTMDLLHVDARGPREMIKLKWWSESLRKFCKPGRYPLSRGMSTASPSVRSGP